MATKTTIALNAAILAAYGSVTLLAPAPWTTLGAYLLLAIIIRCATLGFLIAFGQPPSRPPFKAAAGILFLNLLLGLVFAGLMMGVLWKIGRFWLVGVNFAVPAIEALVAYKSTFSVYSSTRQPLSADRKPRFTQFNTGQCKPTQYTHFRCTIKHENALAAARIRSSRLRPR